MKKPSYFKTLSTRLATLFVIAVLLNYVWEVAQMPLYVEDVNWFEFALHCIIPSLGDGLIVLLIFCTGWVIRGRSDWPDQPGWPGYALMLVTGFGLAVMVEWLGFYALQRWSYTDSMPLLPGFGIGVVPVLQMLILPPLIFRITSLWMGRQLHA